MASDLVGYLFDDKIAEALQKHEVALAARWATEREALERLAARRGQEAERRERAVLAQEREAMVRAVQDVLISRFPATPIARAAVITLIQDPLKLHELHRSLLWAPDQASAEHVLAEAEEAMR